MKALEMHTDSDGRTKTNGSALPVISGTGMMKWEHDNLKPNTKYACVMIELPKGHRLVTDVERETYQRKQAPSDMLYYNQRYQEWASVNPSCEVWDKKWLYAVPNDCTFEQQIALTLTLNGNPINPSELSAESWARLRK